MSGCCKGCPCCGDEDKEDEDKLFNGSEKDNAIDDELIDELIS